jgi:hypothetical protein
MPFSKKSHEYFINFTNVLPYSNTEAVKTKTIEIIRKIDYKKHKIEDSTLDILEKISVYEKNMERSLNY